jgi:hypothetical protein
MPPHSFQRRLYHSILFQPPAQRFTIVQQPSIFRHGSLMRVFSREQIHHPAEETQQRTHVHEPRLVSQRRGQQIGLGGLPHLLVALVQLTQHLLPQRIAFPAILQYVGSVMGNVMDISRGWMPFLVVGNPFYQFVALIGGNQPGNAGPHGRLLQFGIDHLVCRLGHRHQSNQPQILQTQVAFTEGNVLKWAANDHKEFPRADLEGVID